MITVSIGKFFVSEHDDAVTSGKRPGPASCLDLHGFAELAAGAAAVLNGGIDR